MISHRPSLAQHKPADEISNTGPGPDAAPPREVPGLLGIDSAPRLVTRGENKYTTIGEYPSSQPRNHDFQPTPMSEAPVRLDYLQGTFHDSKLHAIDNIFRRFFGPCGQTQRGRMNYTHRREYLPGSEVSYGGDSVASSCYFSISGEPLGTLTLFDQHQLIDAIDDACSHVLKPTRIDIAIDLELQPQPGTIDPISLMIQACRRGELRPSKREYESRDPSTATNEPIGWGITIGTPNSEKMLQFYDKGLETKTKPLGHWQRFEARFKQGTAPPAWEVIRCSGWDVLADNLRSLAVGVVTFQDSSGNLPAWWSHLIANIEANAVPGLATESNLDGFRASLWNAGIGKIARAADEAGIDPVQLLCHLMGDLDRYTRSLRRHSDPVLTGLRDLAATLKFHS